MTIHHYMVETEQFKHFDSLQQATKAVVAGEWPLHKEVTIPFTNPYNRSGDWDVVASRIAGRTVSWNWRYHYRSEDWKITDEGDATFVR